MATRAAASAAAARVGGGSSAGAGARGALRGGGAPPRSGVTARSPLVSSAAAAPRPSRLARLRQNINLGGAAAFLRVLWSPAEAIPHAACADVGCVDFAALAEAGVRAVLFDKDNTLTLPYVDEPHEPLKPALRAAVEAFGAERVAVLSNSAGLTQFDPDGALAAHLEGTLGVRVLRHAHKKPKGTVVEVEAHFAPSSDNDGAVVAAGSVLFVGDRTLTDVVYGNRLGMLTLAVKPLDPSRDPFSVRLARCLEGALATVWRWVGAKPPQHALSGALNLALRRDVQ